MNTVTYFTISLIVIIISLNPISKLKHFFFNFKNLLLYLKTKQNKTNKQKKSLKGTNQKSCFSDDVQEMQARVKACTNICCLNLYIRVFNIFVFYICTGVTYSNWNTHPNFFWVFRIHGNIHFYRSNISTISLWKALIQWKQPTT